MALALIRSKIHLQQLSCPHVGAGVTHNQLAPRSFRSEVLHGRSGPRSFSCERAVLSIHRIHPAARRPRSLGSHRLRHLWAGIVWSSGLLLFRLHRPLGWLSGDERAGLPADGRGSVSAGCQPRKQRRYHEGHKGSRRDVLASCDCVSFGVVIFHLAVS